jgi:Zn-dependent peptidase ImmA (M78 family)
MVGALSESEKNSRNCLRALVPISYLLSERELRERVIKLVQSARTGLRGKALVDEIEEDFGIQICEGYLPKDKDGAYVEDKTKIIINNSVTSYERRRFTIYHELVHHLIRKDQDLYSYLHDAYLGPNDFDRMIELLCNVGAAEFLLPRDILQRSGSINSTRPKCPQSLLRGNL